MSVLGLDIGGANLKAAHTLGQARSVPFALWKEPARLAERLRSLLADMPKADTLAVTMTGELCDCFGSKREGVEAILDAVEQAAGALPVSVWQNDGRFVNVARARKTPLRVAAANWLALATFVGRYAPQGPALLLDIGSTTTDIIPLLNGRPVPIARTDPERLRSSELLYTGVRRTPVCAVLTDDVAAELFATMRDVYLLLGLLDEDADDCDTADGRPATKAAADARLARMLCADLETSTVAERLKLAKRAKDAQGISIAFCCTLVASSLPDRPRTIVWSGEGEFLAQSALKRQHAIPPCRVVSLRIELGTAISKAACAYAVAMLAARD